MNKLKNLIKRIPIISTFAGKIYSKLLSLNFSSSKEYWERRYANNDTSGAGSYNEFADFKAEVINDFVKGKMIQSVIEFGCGDGNQLKLATYPSYIGFDVSQQAIDRCSAIFKNDNSKVFKNISEYNNDKADLVLSLDVIYHLVEDDVFHTYMENLFKSANKYLIIYSTDTDKQESPQAPHVKHRKFTKWLADNITQWILLKKTTNPIKHPVSDEFMADFFIYKKINK